MEIKTAYRVHTLEKLLPLKIPNNILSMSQLFNNYGLKNVKEYPANSLVVAFIPNFFGQLAGFGYTQANVYDTGNTARTIDFSTLIQIINSTAWSESSWGLVLGAGTSAVTLSDYHLSSLITHGSGTGQLFYNLTANYNSFPPITNSNTNYWSTLRPISNFDTSDLTVNEAGIVIRNTAFNFLIERTLLGSPYNFVAKSSAVFEYILKITV
jgi:hypothetical protein